MATDLAKLIQDEPVEILYHHRDHYEIGLALAEAIQQCTTQPVEVRCLIRHPERLHIVLDIHHWPEFSELVKRFVIYNWQQYQYGREHKLHRSLPQYAKAMEIWDYSRCNYDIVFNNARRVLKYVPYGYTPRMTMPLPDNPKQYDVMLLGEGSPRRKHMLDFLHRQDHRVLLADKHYDMAKWRAISESIVQLNMHKTGEFGILELPRIASLLANRQCVVSEFGADQQLNEEYAPYVVFATSDNLPFAVAQCLRNQQMRQRYVDRSSDWMQSKLYVNHIREALAL